MRNITEKVTLTDGRSALMSNLTTAVVVVIAFLSTVPVLLVWSGMKL